MSDIVPTLKTGIQNSVADMTPDERMGEAVQRALPQLAPDVAAKLQGLLTEQNLGILGATVGLWVVAQFTPIGWVADAAVAVLGTIAAVGAFALGYDIGTGLNDLKDFVTISRSAQTSAELDAAANHLAKAVSSLGVDTIAAIVLHKVGEKLSPKAAAEDIAQTKQTLPAKEQGTCIPCEKAAAEKAAAEKAAQSPPEGSISPDSSEVAPDPVGETDAKINDILSDSTPGKVGKTRQYEKPGGFDEANKDFETLAGNSEIKQYGDGIRSAELPDGSTVSVRPNSTEGSPTLQINNRPSGKPIKVRYGD